MTFGSLSERFCREDREKTVERRVLSLACSVTEDVHHSNMFVTLTATLSGNGSARTRKVFNKLSFAAGKELATSKCSVDHKEEVFRARDLQEEQT